jgi:hypothetical protein
MALLATNPTCCRPSLALTLHACAVKVRSEYGRRRQQTVLLPSLDYLKSSEELEVEKQLELQMY